MDAHKKGSSGRFFSAVTIAIAVGLLPACGALPDEFMTTQGALVAFNPSDFSSSVQNPFLPLVPGTIYRTKVTLLPGQDSSVTEVTRQTRRILGIDAMIVHDQAFFQGKLIEDTFDYLKPDRFGNVRYFGEDTKEFDENGNLVSTSGSFLAGSNGAAGPQIFLQGTARVGDVYFEEFAPNNDAEDQAEVTSVNKTIHAAISPDAALKGC